MSLLVKIRESAEFLNNIKKTQAEIGIVLGSGLGSLTNDIEKALEVNYGDIPHFPISTVEGHEGKLIIGTIRGRQVMVMNGRFHYYEGYSMQEITFPIRVMKYMGINNLLITNAAGGINEKFEPGDLMLIKDHIKFFTDGPLRGENIDLFGTRFNDMSIAYSEQLRDLTKEVAYGLGVNLKEGVYSFMPGPSYETPAEIRALKILGADAVGMSTVPEVITASQSGMKVLGISCITNMAAGILDKPLSHQAVIETADLVKDKTITLLKSVIEKWK